MSAMPSLLVPDSPIPPLRPLVVARSRIRWFPASVAIACAAPLLIAATLAPAPAAARWALLLVYAPVAEEIVFRAGLQETLLRRLERWRTGAFTANLVTALAFAAAHVALHPSGLAPLTLLPALLVGRLYQQRRRVAPCVALHAGFNALWLLWAARLFA